MQLDNCNHDLASFQSHGDDSNGLSQGETILSLVLPFLRKDELKKVSKVNKFLHENSSRHFYYQMVQNYPLVSLPGSPAPFPELVNMYLPPRIVLLPDFSSEMLRPRGIYTFPMPACQQPQVYCDPRISDDFALMTWSEKIKAIFKYATMVKSMYSLVTVHREEEHEEFAASEGREVGMVLGQPIQEMVCVLCRALVLNTDLENYPFFLQCLDQYEASKVKVCFYDQIIRETVQEQGAAGTWSILLSQEILKSLPAF